MLAVPRGAIHREGNAAHVFVRHSDSTFERRAVRTGQADDQCVQVTEGLREGEVVVVRGTTALQTAYAALK
jgi:Cu(I)/Ag(I) efflux system membrane fusion protein